MAVVSVSQTGPGRKADGGSDYTFAYTVPFQVIVNNSRDGPLTVANAVDPNTGVAIPPRYSPYEGYETTNDPLALCTSAHPAQDGNAWQKWKVDCEFQTFYRMIKQQDPSQDPVLPWVELETRREKIVRLIDGTPIINAVGQLLDGIEDDVKSITLCFLRNELQINPLLGIYQGALNADAFYFMMPYQGKMDISLDKPQRRNEYVFWPHTYRVKYKYGVNGNGWAINPANRGTAVWRSDGSLGRPIDSNDQPIDGEVNLSANGTAISNSVILLSQVIESDGSQMYPTSLPSVIPSGYLLINPPQRYAGLGLGGAWEEFT